MTFEPGQIIGQHKIIERVGSGGMAIVYRAEHLALGRIDAIKVMHASFADDPDLLARFRREAQIVAKLEHPHIVPIYNFDEADGQPYLVMKFIEGRTLKWHMRKNVLSLDEIDTICTAVANALTYAHQNQVLHRDVKPGNVVLDNDNHPYLTDFGLARIASQGESSMSAGMIVGTPHYLSPEQASGEYDIGPEADVYALGVMLYEMVVGQVPFSADTPHAIVHDHIFTTPPPASEVNPEVPEEVERVLMKALEKKPTNRYTSPDVLMAAFKLAVQQSGLTELREDRSEIAAQSIAEFRKQKPRTARVEAEIDTGEVWRSFKDGAMRIVEEKIRSASGVPKPAADGPYQPPSDAQLNTEIRQRVEKRMDARRKWWGHFVAFMVMNILLWAGARISVNINAAAIQANIDTAASDIEAAELAIGLAAVEQPWVAFVTLFWFGGLMAHRAYVGSLSSWVERRRERALDKRLTREYGGNWANTIQQSQYDRAKQWVDERFCARQRFWSHANVFFYGNVALGVLWGLAVEVLIPVLALLELTGDTQGMSAITTLIDIPVFFGVTMAWLVVLIGHGIRAYFGRGSDAIEREYQRELSVVTSRRTPQPQQKAKNDAHPLEDHSPQPAVRLNADGELTNSTVEAWQGDLGKS